MTTEDKDAKDGKDAKLGNLGAALEQAVQSKVAQENEPKPAATVEQPVAAAATVEVEVAEEVKPKIDALGRSYATGRRKDASARVWIKPGKGEIKINGRPLENYFARGRLQMVARQPFEVAGRAGQFDVMATASGGGLSGQAGALMHGISRALVLREPELRPTLKKEGLLTRDSRAVERKKYGRRKARRSFQFSKR